MQDNPFDAAFDHLRERNAHLTERSTNEANVEMYWLIARYWFIAGANTFCTELISDEALRSPWALLHTIADVQDELNRATSAMFAEMRPPGRTH
jgi:hypothetical protein